MDDFDMMMEDRLMGCNGFTSVDDEVEDEYWEEDAEWEPECWEDEFDD